MPRFEFEGDRNRLAAKVGCRCGGTRITPPRTAGEMLARKRHTDECLDIARVASERAKEPFLGFGAEVGTKFPLKCSVGAGETLSDAKLCIRSDGRAAARLMYNQHMKHSRDLRRYLGLN